MRRIAWIVLLAVLMLMHRRTPRVWQAYLVAGWLSAAAVVANVFQLAVRRNPEIASFNPLALWNSHYVRELDDSGYIDQLYQ